MDKMKGLAKGGWHPPGDMKISRDTWKSDLKGMATGKKKDPYEEGRNHESQPLNSLRDPDSFGAPPKHSGYYDANGASRTGTGLSGGGVSRTGTASSVPSGPSGGWGGPAVQSGYAQQKREREERERQQMQQQEAQQPKAGPGTDTTGLRTDNLPKPPVRRADGASPVTQSPARTSSPALPPRQPPRQAAAPPPVLPPRQNEYPDENTPAPPPPYQEALRQPQVQPNQDPAMINQGAASRLGQSGVSVPGFGIGGNSNASNSQPESPATRGPPAGQLSELQQRFARMNTGASASEAPSPTSPSSGLAAAAHKKAPPPPPPKKAGLASGSASAQQSPGPSSAGFDNSQPPAPPPLPLSSKPRP